MENEFIYNTDVINGLSSDSQLKFEPYLLVKQDDPILTTKLENFNFGNPTLDSVEIASRLIETAKFHNVFGVAANQFGLDYNVFVAGNQDEYVAFYNPVIVSYSSTCVILPETDISNMGLQLHVKRPQDIVLQYQDYNGETKLTQFSGLTSRIIQQNVDRLAGIDFKTRVSKFNLDRQQKALDKKIKRYVRNCMRLENV